MKEDDDEVGWLLEEDEDDFLDELDVDCFEEDDELGVQEDDEEEVGVGRTAGPTLNSQVAFNDIPNLLIPMTVTQ